MSQIPTMPVPNSTLHPLPPVSAKKGMFLQRANVKFSALSIRASMETSSRTEWATLLK